MSAVKSETIQQQIAIIEMTEADLDAVVAIERESDLSPWGRAGYQDELWNPEAIMLVVRRCRSAWAPEHGAVVGFATARMVTAAAEVHINNIAIAIAARRQRLGCALVRSVLAQGRARGATTSLLEVRASNLAALALYRSFGFDVIGERRNYYSDPVENALVMRGYLPPRA